MMSDPRINLEAEDVLSSIRRLISQDAVASQAPMPHRSGADGAFDEDVTPMLVLTPAQRIIEENTADQPPIEAVEAAPDAEPCVDIGDELTRLEATIAEMEAVVSERDPFEPEQTDVCAPEVAEPLTDLPEAVDAQEEKPDDFAENALEAEEDDAMTEKEPDLTASSDDSLPPLEDADIVDEHAEAGTDPDLQDETWVQTAEDGWAEDLREDTEGAIKNLAMGAAKEELRLLSLEDAQGEELTHEHRMSSYQEMREDMALEEALDLELARDADPAAPLPLDAADLRDMVAIMIREELQGALGERITRNVRKFVRREIQRALLSREME